MKFIEIFFKYFNRIKGYLFIDDIIYEMNGVVLHRTSDKLFFLYRDMCTEVMAYCEKQNIEVDKIVFITCYDSSTKVIRENKKLHILMNSDSRLSIVKEDGKTIARVFMGTFIDFKEVDEN